MKKTDVDLSSWFVRATLQLLVWQELHASPHIEHTPILSYPYMDIPASMKFSPLSLLGFYFF